MMLIEEEVSTISRSINAMLKRLTNADTSADSLFQQLISHMSLGHVCLPKKYIEESALEALQNHPAVGDGLSLTPFVYDCNALYSYRFWHQEQWVASYLQQKMMHKPPVDMSQAASALSGLFPSNDSLQIDWQKIAVAMALLTQFCVITGGPGTGKTTTVVRLLLALQQLSNSPLQIGLTAPTGKATIRLQESIEQAMASRSVNTDLHYETKTIHRLLGLSYVGGQPKYHQSTPLPFDILIVDEASMLDLAIFSQLLAAISDSTKLILLGDQYQLASVDAGSVMADICDTNINVFSKERQQELTYLTESELPTQALQSQMQDNIVQLKHSYRFSSGGGIGKLATAVQLNNKHLLAEVLNDENDELTFYSELSIEDLITLATTHYEKYLAAIMTDQSLDTIFHLFESFRVLVAMRKGQYGIANINQEIEKKLHDKNLIDTNTIFYCGRPIMILNNNYEHQLYNGDIGLILPNEQGELMATFRSGDEYIRKIPAMMPIHETAFAMTVHKSQGSEFERVALLLPLTISPIVTRELLYTGITRAKKQITLFATAQMLEYASKTETVRYSNLTERLRLEYDY